MKSSTENAKESHCFSPAAGNNPPLHFSFGDFYEQLFYPRHEIPHHLLLRLNYMVKFLLFMSE